MKLEVLYGNPKKESYEKAKEGSFYLRTVQGDDYKQKYALIKADFKTISHYIGAFSEDYTISDAEKSFKKYKREQHGKTEYRFAIIIDGKLNGLASIRLKDNNQSDVGAWINKDYRNKGYLGSVMKTLLYFGFEKKQRTLIYGDCVPHNKASKALMESVGMKYKKRIKDGVYNNTEKRYYDYLHFEITKKEYMKEKEEWIKINK